MNATIMNSPGQDSPSAQKIMGKPVIETNTRILNLDSGFQHKYLCDGPTFSAGTACAYRCSYCYVETIVGTKPFVTSLLGGNRFQDVVIRRKDAVTRLRNELRTASGKLRFKGVAYEAAKASGKPNDAMAAPWLISLP